jgi:hypothetical protein
MEDLKVSAQLLLELIREQRQQEASGLPLKADNHKLSEVALLLSKSMRAYPPSFSNEEETPPSGTPNTERRVFPQESPMEVE